MSSFSKGQTVRLKSGGPTMTIEDVGSIEGIEQAALCVWFDDKKELKRANFDQALLKYYDPNVTPRVSVVRRKRSE